MSESPRGAGYPMVFFPSDDSDFGRGILVPTTQPGSLDSHALDPHALDPHALAVAVRPDSDLPVLTRVSGVRLVGTGVLFAGNLAYYLAYPSADSRQVLR